MTNFSDVDISNETVCLSSDDRPPRPFGQGSEEFLRHLADACPLVTADPDNPGDPPARYILHEELGAGSIGQIVAAVDEHLGRRVAIKILNGGSGVTRERIARFLLEAQITAQLEHPAIVPVHEIGRMPGGLPYFAMKLVRGESMEELIARLAQGDAAHLERYTLKARLRLFHRLCQGVAYAHAKGVVHRDLKPANILLGVYGEVQIMDWGLAKVDAGRDQALDSVRVIRVDDDIADDGREIAGTPAYMSPEQAAGRAASANPPADVYALGLILAELVCLERVAQDQGPPERGRDRFSRPVELAALNPAIRVDAEVAAVVRRCTDPDPARRYPDASALALDVRDCMEGRIPRAMPTGAGRRFVKWLTRHPIWCGALLGAGLEALALAAWAALWT